MPSKPTKKPAGDIDNPAYGGLTPNQVVAYNLARAREWKGWTQDEAAAALEPYLGKRWSKASVSQAERSIAGRFIRNFDADEIVAFARAYELPIGWFFMPPPPWSDQPGVRITLDTPDHTIIAELVDLVFGTPDQQALMTLRLEQWLAQRPPQLTAAQAQITRLVQARIDTLASAKIDELAQWQTTLRTMANHIEDLEQRSRAAAAAELAGEAPVAPAGSRASSESPPTKEAR